MKKARTNCGTRDSNKEELIGVSKHHLEIIKLINRYAQTGKNILIIGDTGTGKELIAKQLHKESGRQGKLISLNAAALPEDTAFESELFGHERGAFTGATQKRVGKALLANKGTLFIDEIGKMPRSQQGRLLRFVEEKQFRPLGSDKDPILVDVRIIAALKPNEEGELLSDLGYRLGQGEIKTLPLRGRQEDVIAILHHYMKGKIDPRVKAYIYSIELRGNARELKTLSDKEYWEIEGSVDNGLKQLYLNYDDSLNDYCTAYEICSLKANDVSNDAIAETIHRSRECLTKKWHDSYGISLDDFIGKYDITQNRLFYPNFIENAGWDLVVKAVKVRTREK